MSIEAEIREKFWKELTHGPLLMVSLQGGHHHSVPMTPQLDPHANHCFWFYTTKDNRLASGGAAMAQFVNKDHNLFACIDGILMTETDPEIIDRYWSSEVAEWYPQGRNDPNLLMLRFNLGKAEIWNSDVASKGFFKQLFGGDAHKPSKDQHAEISL